MQNHNITCIIPARKNSKGLKNKNIQKINNKELIVFPFELSQKSQYIKNIIFTSDSNKYINILKNKIYIKNKNFHFIKRPKMLSRDNTSTIDVIDHAIKNFFKKTTHVVLLEPTSPLTSLKDLDKAIKILLLKTKKIDSIISVISNLKFSNNYNLKIKSNGKCVFNKQVNNNRQKSNQSFFLSGNFYISKINTLLKKRSFYTKKTYGYIIDKKYYTDIDDILDLEIARTMYRKFVAKKI